MLACYTDKAGLFQQPTRPNATSSGRGRIGSLCRQLRLAERWGELNIAWIPAHSPQAKGRIERFFETAQDRLVKGMRVAKVKTMEQANAYLEQHYLRWWSQTCTVAPENEEDAHQPLEQHHDLAAILSHVESRQVKNDYTIQFDGKIYGIERADISAGLRNAAVRVEQRRDATVAIRFRDKYLRHQLCEPAKPALKPTTSKPVRGANAGGKSRWMEDFLKTPGPSLKQAIAISNATS
jgi:hypothetical protein